MKSILLSLARQAGHFAPYESEVMFAFSDEAFLIAPLVERFKKQLRVTVYMDPYGDIDEFARTYRKTNHFGLFSETKMEPDPSPYFHPFNDPHSPANITQFMPQLRYKTADLTVLASRLVFRMTNMGHKAFLMDRYVEEAWRLEGHSGLCDSICFLEFFEDYKRESGLKIAYEMNTKGRLEARMKLVEFYDFSPTIVQH